MDRRFFVFCFSFLFSGFFVAFPTAHAQFTASDVLGQTNISGDTVFTTGSANNGSSTVNARGLSTPEDVLLDTTYHRLFVSESTNNRVLVFNLDSVNQPIDRTADYVLGQTVFTTSTGGLSSTKFNTPTGLAFDSSRNRLFVSDQVNNRVLVFDVSTIADGEAAVSVLGQATFGSSTAATTQSSVTNQRGLAFDAIHDRLFVADQDHNRVMVFTVTSTIVNGQAATSVLGQTNFTSSTSATTQARMSSPVGVAYDANHDRLFVAELSNSRVLLYDTLNIVNGEIATAVLGQVDFLSSDFPTGTLASSTLTGPYSAAYDSMADALYVSDGFGNRILLYDVLSVANGEGAVGALGQATFVTDVTATTQTGMSTPTGVAVDSATGVLYVVDQANNRVLLFDIPKITKNALSVGTISASYADALSATNVQGTLSYTIATGTAPSGLTLGASTGMFSGTPGAQGTYTFTTRAIDTIGALTIFGGKQFSLVIQGATGGGVYLSDVLRAAGLTEPLQTFPQSFIVSPPTFSSTNPTSSPSLPPPPLTTSPDPVRPQFVRTLLTGMTGEDVRALQKFLNEYGFPVATSGPGSPNFETEVFGRLTRMALIRFQEKYADEILLPLGLVRGTGIFGVRTRDMIQAILVKTF